MSDKTIFLKIITPNRTLYEREVSSVILRCIDGDMAILHGHVPCSVLLDYGALQAYYGDKKELDVLAIFGGIATIKNNKVTVISDMAALPEEIEKLKHDEELEKTVSKIVEDNLDIDIRRAEIALRRTLVKKDYSSYPILNTKEKEEIEEDKDNI